MAQRITELQRLNVFLNQIYTQRNMGEKRREQIATGLKVINPSDDPGRAGTISQFQSTLNRLKKHKDRIAFAENTLAVQESVLDQTQNVLLRGLELAEQGANGSNSASTRAQIGDEVLQLRDQLVALANTTYQGMYLYHGAVDDTQPFTEAASPGYTVPAIPPATLGDSEITRYRYSDVDGSTLTRSVQISDTENIRVSTLGDGVFENAIAALERLGRALEGYGSTLDANGLPDGGGSEYTLPADVGEQTADILSAMESLKAAMEDDIQTERASVGSRMNRLEQASEVMDVTILNTEQARSTVQDADPFEAISEVAMLETGLEALLASGSRISSLSLLDFI